MTSLPVTLIPKPYNCLYSLRQSRRLSGRVRRGSRGSLPRSSFQRRRSWDATPNVRHRKYPMTKPELGTRSLCNSCATKFHDLNNDLIVYPKCVAVFVPPQPDPVRSRRQLERQAWPVPKDAARLHHQTCQRADNQLVGIGFRRPRPLGLLRAQDRELGLHPFLLLLGQHGAVPGWRHVMDPRKGRSDPRTVRRVLRHATCRDRQLRHTCA